MDMPSLSKAKAIDKEESHGSITVLTHAVLTNNLKLVKWLCALGKDNVNAKDELGFTSAHYACQMGFLKALKYLVRYGVDLELRSKDGYTPLMLSIIKGKRDCAEYLINDCRCDLLTTDNDGLNVFQRCCASGELSMAKWLIENGGFKPYVDVPTTSTYINTITQPLHMPDLSVSFAATELYVHQLERQGHDSSSVLLSHPEMNASIQTLVTQIEREEAPIPKIKNMTPFASPQIVTRGKQHQPALPSPRGGAAGRSSSINRGGGGGARSPSVNRGQSGPNADPQLLVEQNPQNFRSPLPICRSQLVALRALAERSPQFHRDFHSDLLKNNTIFANAQSATVANHHSPGGQPAYRSWEDSLPLYEQPDPGSLFLLERAYLLRNEIFSPQFYDQAFIHFGGSPRDANYTSNYLSLKQYLQTQTQAIETAGGQVTQEEYPDLWNLQQKMNLAEHAISNDLENIQDKPVEFASGSTPLMLAAGYGHQHVVDWLLDRCNVDLNHSNSHGLKAWQVALKSRFPLLFISLFVASNALLDTLDRYGNTPLLDAILQKDYPMVCFLLILGANPHFVDQNGKSMIMHAAIVGSIEISKLLINCGLDLTVENNDGHDVQTLAVSHSQWAIVKLIEDALEAQALEMLEQEHGVLGDADLGLDDPSSLQTIDWNSVMQAAQDLEIDVVDYCNRASIDVKILDKSGRNFLHHSAINGRFEHVKVLVEKGNMNIRAKQTQAFRIYAKGTKGMNSLEMALHKKWYIIYCYLFLESVLFHDTRPMNRIVAKHAEAFSDLEASVIQDFALSARESMVRASNPLIIALRIHWLFTELSDLDRIHRQLYLSLAARFNKYAIKLLESIPHFSLAIWVLEEPDALNNTAMKIASLANNTVFLSHHLVDKAMSSLWYATDDPAANDIFPISSLIRRSWFKRLSWDLSLVARVVLFTIFLAYHVEVNDRIGVIEVLSYVFTLCELVPSMPASSRRVNAVAKRASIMDSAPMSPSSPQQSPSSPAQSGDGHAAITMQTGPGAAPEHLTVREKMNLELDKMDQGLNSTNPTPKNSTSAALAPPAGGKKDGKRRSIEMAPVTTTTSPQTSTTTLAQIRRPSTSIVHNHIVTAGTGAPSPPETSTSTSDGEDSVDDQLVIVKPRRLSRVNSTLESPTGTQTTPALVPVPQGGAVLTMEQANQLNAALEQEIRAQEQLQQIRRQRKEEKELQKQLAGKQDSKWSLLVSHLTHDGWALGDLIIAFVTFILLIVRVLPRQTNPDGETARYVIYLTCMSILPMLYYWRVLEIFANWESTGPQLIMVFKMVDDILKFSVLFIVPMVIGFWQYFFLAMDTRQPNVDGYSNAQQIIVTLWNTWWNQISYDFTAFDTTRQVLLLCVSIFITFVASWFLFNMLVGLMAATIDDVMVNAHSEFASLLVKSRWKQDQSLLSPPPPFSLLHLLLVNIVSAISKLPGVRNVGPFKYRKDLWCAYCSKRWSNEPFSITRPTNGAEKRYPPYVLFEYSPQEAGKRLCHHCLRAQRVVGWYHKMSEWLAEMIIRCLIAAPLLVYIVFIYPFQKCATAYQAVKIQREYQKGSRKLTSLFATTPYQYSYFDLEKRPELRFKFEQEQEARKAQLATVQQSQVGEEEVE